MEAYTRLLLAAGIVHPMPAAGMLVQHLRLIP